MKILLIEDNPAEVLLMKEALREINFKGCLEVLCDGESAIQFFSQMAKCLRKNRTFSQPELVLLDLNLPRRNGLEVLKFIKGNRETKHIPTLVMSTSESEEDIASSYAHKANNYLVKPLDFSTFTQMIKDVLEYWSKDVFLGSIA